MSAVPEGVGPGDEFEVLLDDVEASEEARIVTEDDQMIEGETAVSVGPAAVCESMLAPA